MRRPVVFILSRASTSRHDLHIRHQARQRHKSDDNVIEPNWTRAHARKWSDQDRKLLLVSKWRILWRDLVMTYLFCHG